MDHAIQENYYDLVWLDAEFPPMSWQRAVQFSRSKEASGWRLPTIFELQFAKKQDASGFKNGIYWSSSENIEDDRISWYVNFHHASTPPMLFKTDELFVRLVRHSINFNYFNKVSLVDDIVRYKQSDKLPEWHPIFSTSTPNKFSINDNDNENNSTNQPDTPKQTEPPIQRGTATLQKNELTTFHCNQCQQHWIIADKPENKMDWFCAWCGTSVRVSID
jgi:hypothetical protein